MYLDLALSRRGVCRHRAFAFMITANAAGIPARYVTNEAHAFAEIWVPERNWIRVDLGGAALDMDVNNAGDKQMYKPRAADALPRPPEYANNYTQLKGDIRGLTKDQLADGQDAANGTDANGGDPNGNGANGANGADRYAIASRSGGYVRPPRHSGCNAGSIPNVGGSTMAAIALWLMGVPAGLILLLLLLGVLHV